MKRRSEKKHQSKYQIRDVTDCPICEATFASAFVDIGAKRAHPGLYYLSHLRLNSFDAEHACQRLNGHLAEIDTPTELKTVAASLEGLVNNDEDIHIGGKVIHQDGTIGSSHHQNLLLFPNWQAGQPDGTGREECLALRRRRFKATIKMNDVSCIQRITRFLCEM